jgi:hypothetical protein
MVYGLDSRKWRVGHEPTITHSVRGDAAFAVRKRPLAGIVPSAIALLSMSIVTVVVIVGIVTAVAGTEQMRNSDGNLSRWSSSPELRFGDNGVGPSSYTTIVEGQMIELAIDGEYADTAFATPEP